MDAPAEIDYKCDYCHDLGYIRPDVPVGHDLFGKLIPCPKLDCEVGNENRFRVWKQRLTTAKIPRMYSDFTFTSWKKLGGKVEDKQTAFQSSLSFVKWVTSGGHDMGFQLTKDGPRKHSVLFSGPNGTGKTGLAVSIAKQLIDFGMDVLYTRTRDLIQEVQNRYNQSEKPSPTDVLNLYKNASVLILDEFDVDNLTYDRKEIIESLVRYRHGEMLPMIVTTNLSTEDLRDRWGIRTETVLSEMSHLIPVDGTILRQK